MPQLDQLRYAPGRSLVPHDDRVLSRAAERGELVRIRPAVYLPADRWAALAPLEQHRLRAMAAALRARGPIRISHRSAAALHGIPVRMPLGSDVDILVSTREGSRTEHGFRKHAAPDREHDMVVLAGVMLTSIARTVVELAAAEPHGYAVAAADWARAQGLQHDALVALAEQLLPQRRLARAIRVLDFADPRSGSPGESRSRWIIAAHGFPAPELQVPVFDAQGLVGLGDFGWEEFRLLGEFDGLAKYRDPAMRDGRDPADVVVAEKRREDRMRATGRGMVRWTWAELEPETRLVRVLRAAGLPSRRMRALGG